VLAYINRHDVRIWCYINCNWDAQPMWQLNHAPGVYWGDTRIEGKTRWRSSVVIVYTHTHRIYAHIQHVIYFVVRSMH
jgi:hypothetical protein